MAITTVLMFKRVFHLTLRAVQSFINSFNKLKSADSLSGLFLRK
ncbi:hypothetical protein M977_00184 [Buttiauxella gaviniae ATCC 51604]|uniref:Uncharacterized protein n=1 Tax=Buttiauxella gaviniae ATCC 51604 TaxID=1354253 RepID=A0A1B7I6A1_9ENTR|nr:hypothetical protein M977_00184 [Buttiauxella gaviniae ATCC 51604]